MYKKVKSYLTISSIVVLVLSLQSIHMYISSFAFEDLYQNFENQNYNQVKNSPNVGLNNRLKMFVQEYNPNLTRILNDMYADILPNGKDITITMHFTYYNSGEDTVYNIIHAIDITTILIESRISSIVVFDAIGDINYEWDFLVNINLINISLRLPLDPFQFTSFTISFLLENAIVSNPDITFNYIVQWTLTFDEDIEQFSLTVTLPIQFELYNQSALDPIPNYRSADGRRLEWIFYNILTDQDKTWIIRFKNYVTEEHPISIFKPIYWIAVVGTFLGGAIIGIIGMYFYLKLKTDTERQEIVETLLSHPEKEIIKIIKKHDGVITQSKIVDLTVFSKAKVSYYLSELEKKEIISRERWGRMNRIRIIDDSVDKVYFSDSENIETD